MPEITPPDMVFSMTVDEIAEAVQGAHRATDDLSRASEHAPQPLAGKLGRCAERFRDALEGEGL